MTRTLQDAEAQMSEIFTLDAVAVTPDGEVLRNLLVTVLDRDRLSDDLLGLGLTDGDGAFRLSFTRREFNQEWYENEALPDLHLIFSMVEGRAVRPIYERSFPGLTFDGGGESLGEVVIETWRGAETDTLAGVDPMAGRDKRVRRLDLDHALVRACLTEVAPMVEHLTGWEGLLDDLNIDVTNDLARYTLEPLLAALGMKAGGLQARALGMVANRLMDFLGLYDPLTHTLVIHEEKAAANNLDALKVIVGHELVHVGQFKADPTLRARHRRHLEEMASLEIDEEALASNPDLIADLMRRSPMNEMMSELEGYAFYIQRDFLEKHYNMATWFEHSSWFDGLSRAFLTGLVPESEGVDEVKRAQYTDGIERFRGRQQGARPARFGSGDGRAQ